MGAGAMVTGQRSCAVNVFVMCAAYCVTSNVRRIDRLTPPLYSLLAFDAGANNLVPLEICAKIEGIAPFLVAWHGDLLCWSPFFGVDFLVSSPFLILLGIRLLIPATALSCALRLRFSPVSSNATSPPHPPHPNPVPRNNRENLRWEEVLCVHCDTHVPRGRA